MPYKQIYFPIRGRGEAVRLLCFDNGLELNDEPIVWADWLKMKPNTIFGQLPVYFDGDLELAQSVAFLRHLARKHGLYGSNDTEATLIDMVSDGQEDFRQKYIKLIYYNYDEGKEAYIKELPAELEKFEKLLKSNNGGQGFFVGNKISFVDYLLFDLFDNHLVLTPTALDGFPLLKAYHERIAARPAIHQYRQTEAFLQRPVNGNGKQ